MLGKKTVLFVLVTAVSLALLSVAAETKTADMKGKPWKIVGQLEEACSCSAACPCWFGSKPTKMTCSGTQFLFIEKGKYGDTSLDGLAIGNTIQSPSGQTMMDSYGKWSFNYYYIDAKATPEQQAALKAIALTVLMGESSPKREFRVVPIERVIDGKEHKISLGKYGKFSGHVVEGGLGGPAKIVNPPGADPLHHEYEQGNTTQMTYTDAGQNWKFEGSNYMLGSFELDSEQYEKYSAGLAQKMADQKKMK